jgi:DNA-binding MarR family transcriptional regulator
MAALLADFFTLFNDKLLPVFSPGKKAECELSKSQVMVLMMIRRKPHSTATQLGDNLNMTKASITGIVDTLEAKGLALREVDSGDRRKALLSLTEPGMLLGDELSRNFNAALEARLAGLDEADWSALAHHLSGFTALLSKL